jgi:hypothetical protein
MKNPLALDPARPIRIDGIAYMIEGRQGSDLALFNTLTGQTLTMTYSAVMRRAGLSDIPLQALGEIGVADQHLPKHRRFIQRHVEEVAYGKPHDADGYREGYDPETTTLEERLERKAAEFAALGLPGGSHSNLKKLVGKIRRQGPAGMVDGRSMRKVDPFAGIDPRLYQLMVARVNEAKDKSTASKQQLVTDVRCDWIAEYPGELDSLPSDRTLRRKFDITNAAPATGTDKAVVERYHEALKDLFSRNFAGFSGGNPGDRGRRIEDEPGIVSIHTLAYVLDLWVRHVWQNLETNALRDPAHPGVRYSPNTMYEALTYRTGCIFTPITPNTFIGLLPFEVRKVDRMGLHLSNRRYDCPELDPYRGKPSGDKLIGDRWRVHYEPNNPSAVWLEVPPLDSFPDAGEFVECPWANLDAFEAPFERAIAESAENISRLGHQIPEKERSLRSRQFLKGAVAAAEKEERTAAEREAKDRLAAEQGMARPRPRTVVEPEDPAELWTHAFYCGSVWPVRPAQRRNHPNWA